MPSKPYYIVVSIDLNELLDFTHNTIKAHGIYTHRKTAQRVRDRYNRNSRVRKFFVKTSYLKKDSLKHMEKPNATQS